MRGEHADKFIHIGPQKGAAAKADAGHARLKQMRGVNGREPAVVFGLVSHAGDNPHPQIHLDIGLDHVRIGRREHHPGFKPGRVKRAVQLRTAGKTEYVSDDRVVGQQRQREPVGAGQRVIGPDDDTAVPAIAGHHDQIIKQFQRLGGDGEVNRALGGQFRDLPRRALVHVQGDIRVFCHETADNIGQHIAGLGMRGRNRQAALAFVAEVGRHPLDALDLVEDLGGDLDNDPAGRGDLAQVFALAPEDLHIELLLQHADLLADAGLRGIEPLGRGRDIQPVPRDLPDISQLLNLHRHAPYKKTV